MDTINITALNVSTQIGVYDWEQRIKQNLLIDITISTDFSACEDNIAKTIDYDRLCQTVTQYVESKAFQLIETVALQVAQLIKQEFSVTEVKVAVSKPRAVKNAANVQAITAL